MQVRYIIMTMVRNFPKYKLLLTTNQNGNVQLPDRSDFITIDGNIYRVFNRHFKMKSDDAVNGKIYNSVDIFIEDYSECEEPTIL